jgi:hypothetical protein
MLQFMENTWFLWWIISVVIILRWFQVLSVDPDVESPHTRAGSNSKPSSAPGDQLPLHA